MNMWKRAQVYLKQHPRHVYTIFFFLGYVWDNIMLARVDRIWDQLVLGSYMLVVALCIILIHWQNDRFQEAKTLKRFGSWLSDIMLFCLGGLYSGLLVYNTHTGSWYDSWPFLLILLALFIGIEAFKKQYSRLAFQVVTFYLPVFAYSVFYVPLVTKTVDTKSFLIAGLISLALIAGLVSVLLTIARERTQAALLYIVSGVAAVFLLINTFYFLNVIPPLPLALQHIGIYHSVEHTPDGYTLMYEPNPRYMFWRETNSIYHQNSTDPAYIFASVFAPPGITLTIYHHWEWFDPNMKIWVTKAYIPYTISGGRIHGYRGYTEKSALMAGDWRVAVETERGAVLGRIQFKVVSGDGALTLDTVKK